MKRWRWKERVKRRKSIRKRSTNQIQRKGALPRYVYYDWSRACTLDWVIRVSVKFVIVTATVFEKCRSMIKKVSCTTSWPSVWRAWYSFVVWELQILILFENMLNITLLLTFFVYHHRMLLMMKLLLTRRKRRNTKRTNLTQRMTASCNTLVRHCKKKVFFSSIAYHHWFLNNVISILFLWDNDKGSVWGELSCGWCTEMSPWRGFAAKECNLLNRTSCS